MATAMCLSDLPIGKTGIIKQINTTSPIARRLMDLGFIPGTNVRAITKSPLGDPTTFEVRGYQMGLRKSESGIIKVEVAPDGQ